MVRALIRVLLVSGLMTVLLACARDASIPATVETTPTASMTPTEQSPSSTATNTVRPIPRITPRPTMTPTALTVTDRTLTIVAGYEAQPEGTAESVKTRWLYDEDCQPPCWQHLVPGETRLDDAIAILEANPNVFSVHLSGVDWQPNLHWYGRGLSNGFAELGGEEDKTLKSIHLSFESDLPVQSIIDDLDDPTHVWIHIDEEGNWYSRSFGLIYPQKGLLALGSAGSMWQRVEDKALQELEVERLMLFPAVDSIGGYAALGWGVHTQLSSIREWDETKSYRDYCLDIYEPATSTRDLCPE